VPTLPFSDYCYRDTALGDLNKRNVVLHVDKIKDHMPRNKRECYTTVWRYRSDFLDYVTEKGSVKGYSGSAYGDTFWIDVDDEDLHRSQQSAVFVAGILMSEFGVQLEDLRFFFSGKKGFHVGVPSCTFGAEPSELLPSAFSELARRVSEAAGVAVDLSIYRQVSLLRLPNSINAKSGLFKVGVTFEEMGGKLEDILVLAEGPRSKLREGPQEPNETLTEIYRKIVRGIKRSRLEAKEAAQRGEVPMLDGGRATPPKWDKVCLYRMMQGVPNGQRNNVALRIAVHLRQKGMTLSMATAALAAWNSKNESPLEDVDIVDVAQRAFENNDYDFGCNDAMLDRYCHDSCHLYAAKMGEQEADGDKKPSSVMSVAELMEKYRNYMREPETHKVTWGIKWLDEKTQMLSPGQVAMIAARAGVGKTALTLKILGANSDKGTACLLVSLEQLGEEMYERMVQSAAEKTGSQVAEGFMGAIEDNPNMEALAAVTQSRFGLVYVCDDDRLNVKQLKERVKAAETKAGQKIRLLAVDYLGRMKGDGKDFYQQVSNIAIGLKQIAKECRLAVLVLVQVNRTGKSGSSEVTLDMARDSGQVEEAMDYAIGMWQLSDDFPDTTDDKVRTLKVNTGVAGKFTDVPNTVDYYPIIIQVNKNRKGPKGEHVRRGLIFRPSVMRFEEDLAWRPDERETVTLTGE
jgi:replicative DNA helicase